MVKSQQVECYPISANDVKWTSIPLSEVIRVGNRLEASVFGIEGRRARKALSDCKWELVPLYGEKGLTTAYTCGRFKRVWLKKSNMPIFQPSSIPDIKPIPDGYLSSVTKVNVDKLRVLREQILLTCSGTIGKITMVSKTLDNQIFSHDLIRMNVKQKDSVGYIYAFLKSNLGNSLLVTNTYGAVISHIEPEHLSDILIPNPPDGIKRKIHNLIMQSFELRDKSNELIDEATNILIDELQLPKIEDFDIDKYGNDDEVNSYTVKLSELNERLDGSYHSPLAKVIKKHFEKYAEETTVVGDASISEKIILAGVFKRVYVEEGNGIPFLGGKEITQLSPNTEKFLSRSHHQKRYEKELKVEENTILVTDRGTIGTVVFSPKHFKKFAVSQNVLKLQAKNNEIAGYLYIFLNSDYGKELIKQQTYGSVVNMIDNNSLANVPFPILKNKSKQKEINDLALKANLLRYEAYELEQEALRIMNDEVIFA